jgi:hypothetical protein
LSSICLPREFLAVSGYGEPEVDFVAVRMGIIAANDGALEAIAGGPESGADAEPFGRRHLSETAIVDIARFGRGVA